MGGTAKCSRSLLKATFIDPTLRRQSVERLPLVIEEKAKLTMVKSQCTMGGPGMLAWPSSVVYCNHRVNACNTAYGCMKLGKGTEVRFGDADRSNCAHTRDLV